MNTKTAYLCIIIPSLLNVIVGLMVVTGIYIPILQGIILSVMDLSPILITYAVIVLLLKKKTKKNLLISKIMAVAVIPVIIKYTVGLVGFDGLNFITWPMVYGLYNISIITGSVVLFKSYKGTTKIFIPTLLMLLNALHLINRMFASLITKHVSQGLFYEYRAGLFLMLDAAIFVICLGLYIKAIKNENPGA